MDEQEMRCDEFAETLLRGTGLSVMDAVRLALELHETLPSELENRQSSVNYMRRVIRVGSDVCASEIRSVSFREAVERSLLYRAGRRIRTLAEIRQCCRRVLRSYPRLAETPVRCITSEFCREVIMGVFHTPTTQRKARRLLHGIFAFSMRHGWCDRNPAAAVDIPAAPEKPIDILSLNQVHRLLATARKAKHLPCAPGVGMMLWAGIRPTELTRLRWEDVRMDERVITIEARHSKTGGARQVTIHPVLLRWLHETANFRLPRSLIVPRAWVRRWRELRQAAGFSAWHPDALRHTYASYYLKHFRDCKELQIEMGHADSQLLRTRYLAMKGITSEGAAEFWGKRRSRDFVEKDA